VNPKITQLPTNHVGLYFAADYHSQRSVGIHLMQIVDDLAVRHDPMTRAQRRGGSGFSEALDEFGLLGFVWEWEIERAVEACAFWGEEPSNVAAMWEWLLSRRMSGIWAERSNGEIFKPGELLEDGIYMTPDGCRKRPRRLEEWKATWRSSRGLDSGNFEERNWKWCIQAACYCRALGINEAVIRVYHVNGGYEKGQMGAPILTAWKIRWTDQQLEEVWRMVLNHKETMLEEGKLRLPEERAA